MRTRTSIAALAVSLVVLGAACSGDDDDDAATTDETAADQAVEEHNEADVEFAQMMIPHHRQAIEMAELAPDRAEDPRILDLAERVQAAQDPEIERMTQWLESWDEEVPAEDSEDHDMDMGSETTMAGDEMSAEDMAALEAASGPEFDRMFAQMMIEHHQGAIAMANDEINDGQFPDATALAEDIVAAQEAEISELQDFLAGAR
jgi:uncharacterized protein (DUF305 family)